MNAMYVERVTQVLFPFLGEKNWSLPALQLSRFRVRQQKQQGLSSTVVLYMNQEKIESMSNRKARLLHSLHCSFTCSARIYSGVKPSQSL